MLALPLTAMPPIAVEVPPSDTMSLLLFEALLP
jgi:hypothetical protein